LRHYTSGCGKAARKTQAEQFQSPAAIIVDVSTRSQCARWMFWTGAVLLGILCPEQRKSRDLKEQEQAVWKRGVTCKGNPWGAIRKGAAW